MWDKLSIKDKAEIIKMGVANGIRDLNTIRDTYNNIYAEGGDTNLLNNQDFLNQYGIHWDEDPLMNDYYAQHPSELNKSTTVGIPAAYNNRVLVNRYGVPQSQQSLNRYAKDYALVQPQVSRKEEREVEKKAIDRNIEQNMSQAPLLFSGLSFLNLASPVNWYGTIARQSNPKYYGEGHNWTEDLIFGNAGLFTDKYAKEHPYLSTLGNLTTDIITNAGIVKGLNTLSKNINATKNIIPVTEKAEKLAAAEERIKSLGINMTKQYKEMYSQIKDPILKDIIDTSPQYLEEVWEQQIKHGGATEEFIKDLIKKANSYKRNMDSSVFTEKDFRTIKGRNGKYKGNLGTIDVEGEIPSGPYGNFSAYFEGLPELTGDMSTWWGQRIPKGVNVEKGIHSQSPLLKDMKDKILNDLGEIVDTDNLFFQTYEGPKEFIKYPYHQIFLGEPGTLLPNFKVTVGKNPPTGFTFGKGYKHGGKLIKK